MSIRRSSWATLSPEFFFYPFHDGEAKGEMPASKNWRQTGAENSERKTSQEIDPKEAPEM